jgi:transporter family protein
MKQWIAFALISMTFAGMTSVIAKFGMKNVSSDAALVIRTTFVFGFVWMNGIVFNKIRELGSLTKSDILFLALSAATTSFSWIFYYKAIKSGDVSVVASIDKASVVITILLSLILLREPITPKLAIGASLIVLGTIMLIWK